jgi:hypothetical protein
MQKMTIIHYYGQNKLFQIKTHQILKLQMKIQCNEIQKILIEHFATIHRKIVEFLRLCKTAE